MSILVVVLMALSSLSRLQDKFLAKATLSLSPRDNRVIVDPLDARATNVVSLKEEPGAVKLGRLDPAGEGIVREKIYASVEHENFS